MRRKDIKDNPGLRFPEFTEPYIYKRFGKLLAKEARSFKMEDESEYRLVTVKRGYGGVFLRGIFKGKKVLVKSQFLLKTGDFLISKRQICHNACGIVPSSLEGAIVSNEYTVFLPKKDLDIVYFRYFCCIPIISHTFFLSSIGVHIEKMLFKVDDWLKWEFPFPPLQEQQKIASFLAAVDKKIEQLTRKKELLEQYKKGVMQKFFSQEIRFKDENGQDYPDWEEKRLRDTGEIITGKTPTTSDEKLWNGDVQFLTPSDITDNQKYQIKTRRSVVLTAKMKVLPPDSIIYTCIGSLGKMCISKYPCITNQQINSIVPSDTIENEFIYYALLELTPKIKSIQANAILPIINKTQFSKIIIYAPRSREEQQRITGSLSSIDEKIEFVKTQITQTQNFKKGLLQKMFV